MREERVSFIQEVQPDKDSIAMRFNQYPTISREAFEIEKNAKNKAYFFILSHGLLDEFAKLCKDYHSDNPHEDCKKLILKEMA